LRNKGNKFYQNTHGTVLRVKTKAKRIKRMTLLKRQRKPKVKTAAKPLA
jgi:hypothetical protein